MVNSAGIQASLAGRYASALFELASEQGPKGAAGVEKDLDSLEAALAESADLRDLSVNPLLGRKQQGAAIAAVAKAMKLDDLTAKFLGVLANNRRLADLSDIIRAYRTIAASHRGEMSAKVASAHPLSAKQIDALAKKLSEREGQSVSLTASVDPELLGGLVVTIGSKRIDGSIRTRLNSLASAMKG